MSAARRYVRELAAIPRRDGERIALAAPMPGWFRSPPVPGALLAEGMMLGELEVLGVRHRLLVPAGAHGIVVASSEGRRLARRAVGYGETLVTLDPSAVGTSRASAPSHEAALQQAEGVVFRAPMSGRYYARPGPDAEPFVRVGEVVETGRTVALIEVMKTFTRVPYGGAGLPERATIVAIVPRDGDDVNAGDPLLRLEPA